MASYNPYFAETDWDTTYNDSVLLSDFKDFKYIGNGGYSKVYEAKNKLDGQKYAIKSKPFTYSEEELEIVLREVKALAQLEHPNIVKFHHAWLGTLYLDDIIDEKDRDDSSNSIEFRNSSREQGMKRKSNDAMNVSSAKRKKLSASLFEPKCTLYIKMELCSGQSLLIWMQNTKKRERDTVNKMVLQIIDAVAYIHSQNYMHRDLKPANIFLTHDKTIKVGDFNLVKNIVPDNQNSEDCDLHTSYLGTKMYRSPELVANQTYSEKVDIYAIGVIWIELLIYFSTEYERLIELGDLRNGIFPINFSSQFRMEHESLQKMLAEEADNRLDAEEAFDELLNIVYS